MYYSDMTYSYRYINVEDNSYICQVHAEYKYMQSVSTIAIRLVDKFKDKGQKAQSYTTKTNDNDGIQVTQYNTQQTWN